jgi:hypothetical protein
MRILHSRPYIEDPSSRGGRFRYACDLVCSATRRTPLAMQSSVLLEITYFPALSWTCYVTGSSESGEGVEVGVWGVVWTFGRRGDVE